MTTDKQNRRMQRRWIATFFLGSVFQLGFLESCNDRLVEATRIFDPCGTILANCTPGSFETNNADVGDFCVDPTCTIPGMCDPNPPLGTIRDICP